MPREHEQLMTTCPPAEADTGLQVETVIPRPAHGRRPVVSIGSRVEPVAPPVPRIARLMALAIKLQDMVARCEVPDYADIARLGYVTRARITQIMNMVLLAPDIQEELLDLTNETALSEHEMRTVASHVSWAEQRRVLRALERSSTSSLPTAQGQ